MVLTFEQRAEWLWDTVRQLAKLPSMDDDSMTGLIFEDLDVDVTSALHEDNVVVLQNEGFVSPSATPRLIAIRDTYLELVSSAHACEEYGAPAIRTNSTWAGVFAESDCLLSAHEGKA